LSVQTLILSLAPFFVDCISEADLDEMNVELIRNTLYKAYLEAFYGFCQDLGGETAEVMCEILAVSPGPNIQDSHWLIDVLSHVLYIYM
jgi:hypothetical protein